VAHAGLAADRGGIEERAADPDEIGAERQRLQKEIKRAEDAIAFGRAKLARPELAERAPAEIERLVGDYARAIESREVGAVRRTYPGMSDAQQKGFEDFFRAVKSLRVTFTLNGLDVNGAAAEGRLMGAYDYVSSSGKPEHQPVTFRATFAREGGSWRLVAVR